jgi:hypothetical protein
MILLASRFARVFSVSPIVPDAAGSESPLRPGFSLLLWSVGPEFALNRLDDLPEALVSRHIEQLLNDAVKRRLIDVLSDYPRDLAERCVRHFHPVSPFSPSR